MPDILVSAVIIITFMMCCAYVDDIIGMVKAKTWNYNVNKSLIVTWVGLVVMVLNLLSIGSLPQVDEGTMIAWFMAMFVSLVLQVVRVAFTVYYRYLA